MTSGIEMKDITQKLWTKIYEQENMIETLGALLDQVLKRLDKLEESKNNNSILRQGQGNDNNGC